MHFNQGSRIKFIKGSNLSSKNYNYTAPHRAHALVWLSFAVVFGAHKISFNGIDLSGCGGLILSGCQMPTELHTHFPSSAGWGWQESLWVKIKAGRTVINYYHGEKTLDLEKINLLLIKNIIGWRETNTEIKNAFCNLLPSSQAQLHSFIPTIPIASPLPIPNGAVRMRNQYCG